MDGDLTDQTLTHRQRLSEFLDRDLVRNGILGVIVFNAITLGLSTSKNVQASYGQVLETVDTIVLTIFVVELLLKFYAYGLNFFRNPWNIFDLTIVSIGLLPQGSGLSALRGLRVIRALRVLSIVPQMRAVVQALLDALPGMGAVIIMLSIVYYVFAVMATLMYGDTFPDWFGTLGASLYSLFQIMTLESWSMGIVRPVMEVHPLAWLFFVPFIIITSFSVLNLFIGLLVNTMQAAVEEETEAEFEKVRDLVISENEQVSSTIKALHDEVVALRAEIGRGKGE